MQQILDRHGYRYTLASMGQKGLLGANAVKAYIALPQDAPAELDADQGVAQL
jgi:hypothetical protein